MKDETLPLHIWQFVGLQSKMYSIVTMDKMTSEDSHEEQKAKGIPKKALIERRQDSYARALFQHERDPVKFLKFVSKKHTVTLERQRPRRAGQSL